MRQDANATLTSDSNDCLYAGSPDLVILPPLVGLKTERSGDRVQKRHHLAPFRPNQNPPWSLSPGRSN